MVFFGFAFEFGSYFTEGTPSQSNMHLPSIFINFNCIEYFFYKIYLHFLLLIVIFCLCNSLSSDQNVYRGSPITENNAFVFLREHWGHCF